MPLPMPLLTLLLMPCATLAAGAPQQVVGLDFMQRPDPAHPPQPGPVGSNLLAVAKIDLATGNVTSRAAPFFTNDTLNGYSCIQAFRPHPATYFVISGGAPVLLLSVDVGSGVSTSIALSQQLVFFDISWSPAGLGGGGVLYAFAAAPPYNDDSVGIYQVDPVTGTVGPSLGAVKYSSAYAEPRPCESGFTKSSTSKDPRFYFSVATNKKDPDDGDQALLTYDIHQGKVVAQVPWSQAHNGSLNALLTLTLPHAGADSVLAIATDPEPSKENHRLLELVSIEPGTGVGTVLAGVPGPEPDAVMIPSLGSLAANVQGTEAITIVMDNAMATFYSITFDLTTVAGTGKAVAVRRPLTQRSNLWNLQYLPPSQ
jgi:hypothetical protein